jgi:hypothetical protein
MYATEERELRFLHFRKTCATDMSPKRRAPYVISAAQKNKQHIGKTSNGRCSAGQRELR